MLALPLSEPYARKTRTVTPSQDFGGGELSLFFANCEQDSRVNFDVEVALYNVRGGCLLRRLCEALLRFMRSACSAWRRHVNAAAACDGCSLMCQLATAEIKAGSVAGAAFDA